MVKNISMKDTSKIVRDILKENFPEIQFSIRISRSSIKIKWVDGPSVPAVEHLVKQFEGASFDGSNDLKSYHDTVWQGEEVHFSADWVMCTRNMSRTFVEAIVAQFSKHFALTPQDIEVCGREDDAWAEIRNYQVYSKKIWLHRLLENTDAKDMLRAYEAEKEREARERTEAWKAFEERQEREARERAEAEAKAECERLAKEQAEFEQWQAEYLRNEQWQREQFNRWKQEQARGEAQ
jgi:hypothetical protein